MQTCQLQATGPPQVVGGASVIAAPVKCVVCYSREFRKEKLLFCGHTDPPMWTANTVLLASGSPSQAGEEWTAKPLLLLNHSPHVRHRVAPFCWDTGLLLSPASSSHRNNRTGQVRVCLGLGSWRLLAALFVAHLHDMSPPLPQKLVAIGNCTLVGS